MSDPTEHGDNSMTPEAIRLECLRLANIRAHGGGSSDAEGVVYHARLYADFVLGTRDAEIVGAARELAEKVRDVS